MSEEVARMNREAMQAMAAGNLAAAEGTLAEAVKRDGGSVVLWLNLAVVRRQRADFEGAQAALREVLRLDNRNFTALLMQAALLDRQGRDVEAAVAYGIALAQAPPEKQIDGPTRDALARAREVHGRHVAELGRYIRERAGDAQGRCTPVERQRLESFIETTLRRRRRYQQEPTDFYYPGLPSIEFYAREEFPWLDGFEAATGAIQGELGRVLIDDAKEFAPYIQYDDHLPLEQWRELNRNPRWSAFHFYDRGRPIEAHCLRAPATFAAVGKLPQAEVDGRSPTAMYSVLQPRTRIPPHTGVANFRLVVHLPLVMPPDCGFRVGGETREWRIGEAWVFDDTLEHEAWNESGEIRIILICDIWSPRLSQEERDAIRAVIAATDAFRGGPPPAQI